MVQSGWRDGRILRVEIDVDDVGRRSGRRAERPRRVQPPARAVQMYGRGDVGRHLEGPGDVDAGRDNAQLFSVEELVGDDLEAAIAVILKCGARHGCPDTGGGREDGDIGLGSPNVRGEHKASGLFGCHAHRMMPSSYKKPIGTHKNIIVIASGVGVITAAKTAIRNHAILR